MQDADRILSERDWYATLNMARQGSTWLSSIAMHRKHDLRTTKSYRLDDLQHGVVNRYRTILCEHLDTQACCNTEDAQGGRFQRDITRQSGVFGPLFAPQITDGTICLADRR